MSDAAFAIESTFLEPPAAPAAPPAPPAAKLKQRVAMDAFTHGVTGHNMFLTLEELPAYLKLGADYMEELRPVGTRETQLAQKVVDTNWRINRVAAIENNMLNSALLNNVTEGRTQDDKLEGMVAQSDGFRVDCQGPNAFEKLGRYEARLTRTLFKMTEELERLQTLRLRRAPEDTFILAECQAWLWYRDTLAKTKRLNTAKSFTSKDISFGKKDFAAAAGAIADYAAQTGLLSQKDRELLERFTAA